MQPCQARENLRRLFIAACVLVLLISNAQRSCALRLQGQVGAHDPSRVVKCGGQYYLYCTGSNIQMHRSRDLIHWTIGPNVLAAGDKANGVPAWARKKVPGNTSSDGWAPDVVFFNNAYYLYYSFSSFGSKISVIGLATNPTLDPDDPKYHWTDQGIVLASERSSDFNAIDPCPIHTAQGEWWLSFGSWNTGGIKIVQLDKNTGKPLTSAPYRSIAAGQRTGPEGSFVYAHGGYYYVFENEGLCCQGVNSTYSVMMGRSVSVTGPYLDRQGRDLAKGGGTPFLGTYSNRIGPGQIGIFQEAGIDRVTFHYYDGYGFGSPTLGMETLVWDADGWPRAGDDLPGGIYAIASAANGLLMGVHNQLLADGTALDQYRDIGSNYQRWDVSPLGDGYYRLTSVGNGKVIDLSYCSAAEGTPVDLYMWLGNNCQRWLIEQTSAGMYRIVSSSSGSVISVPDNSKREGATLVECAWQGTTGQQWQFIRQ